MLALAALLLAAAPPSLEPRPKAPPPNMVVDGVPELPGAVAERLRQYNNTRSAALYDWDPDGTGLLIGTRFGETMQIHHVAAPGADRQQLTFFTEPVAAAAYDPAEGGKGFYFRLDQGGAEFYQYLWLDRATGRSTRLTDGKSRNETLLPSNAGGLAAFASTARNGTDFDIYTVAHHDPATVKRVAELKGQWNPLDWSPDDSQLLLKHFVSINESYLHLLDLKTGKLTELNPGKKVAYGEARFARSGGAVLYTSDEDAEFLRLVRYELASGKQQVLTPDLKWDVEKLEVSRDGKWLAYTANEGGRSALFLGPVAGPGQRVPLPVGVVTGLAFDRQSKRLGLALSTASAPGDIFSVDLPGRAVTRWTQSEVGGLNPETFVTPELIEFTSFDGRKLPAWYYRPHPKAGAGKVPVIVNIHGGPESQSVASFNPMTQYLVNELGAAVLLPNVRGSAGYGKSYLLLDNGARREDSVKDIGALLDWVATRPELDAARVAVIGGSYGGYMVLSSLTHYSDRLRCGIDVVGISNFVTFLEHTEAYRRDLRRAEYGDERDPELRKLLESISPTTNAGKIHRPLLVAQGANDPRVPASEAEQIVRTVRKNGGTAWYMLAKDEGHGFQKQANKEYFTTAESVFFEQCLLK